MMKEKEAELIIIAGQNGSGKSTFRDENIKEFENIKIIDPDKIKREQNISSPHAARIALKEIKECLNNQTSFMQETTLSSQQPINTMKQGKEKGFKTKLVFVGINSWNTSVKRVASRVAQGGHDIPLDDIKRRFQKTLDNLPKAIEYADKVTIFDNSENREEILSIEGKKAIIKKQPPEYLRKACVELQQKGYKFYDARKEVEKKPKLEQKNKKKLKKNKGLTL